MSKRNLLGALCVWLLCSGATAGEAFVALDRTQAKALTDPATHTTPTIVALWSSDCIHCKANLKLFAAMNKADKRLRVITVATEPVNAELAEPLDRLALPGKRYAYGTDPPEALAFALDPKWSGELPRTLLFDGRGGKLAKSGVLEESAVREALGINAPRRR
jgi:hypothetical protein